MKTTRKRLRTPAPPKPPTGAIPPMSAHQPPSAATPWNVAPSPEHGPTCDRLRQLVSSTLTLHRPATALFYVDKLLTLSNHAIDDVLLASSALFASGEFARAVLLLEKRGQSSTPNLKVVLLTAQCHAALSHWELALEALRPVLDEAVTDARGVAGLGASVGHTPGFEINPVSIMCSLRADAHIQLDDPGSAVEWFRFALQVDLYNAEAFHSLVDLHLLSSAEETALLDSLAFSEADGVIRDLYAARLSRYDITVAIPAKFKALEDQGLGGNPDVQATKAECLYYQHDFSSACDLTRAIRTVDPFDTRSTTVHVASLLSLGKASDLFYTAHTLVDANPRAAVAWFAVGCYYHCVGKFSLARQYFGKATSIDAHFAPAWLGIGHATSAQDDSDQAMAAYRTASRLFPGCHMPLLCMAIECLRTNNVSLADRYLCQARDICPSDPLVYNELGVLHYRSGRFKEAMELFQFVVNLTRDVPRHLQDAWEPAMFNLGHCYRKLGRFDDAIGAYETCLALVPNSTSSFSALGFTYLLQDECDRAIDYFHLALGVCPDDTFAQQMLRNALSLSFHRGFDAVFAGIDGLPPTAAPPQAIPLAPPPMATPGAYATPEIGAAAGMAPLLRTPAAGVTPAPQRTPLDSSGMSYGTPASGVSPSSSAFMTPDALPPADSFGGLSGIGSPRAPPS